MKKILLSLAFVFFSLLTILPLPALAQESVQAYLFWGEGCPHCAKEKVFFDQYLLAHPNVTLSQFEIYNNRENAKLLQHIATSLDIEVSGVPLLIIADTPIAGFSPESTPKKIESIVKKCSNNPCPDSVYAFVHEPETTSSSTVATLSDEEQLAVPFFGEIQPKDVSLPLLSIVLGVIDGFNPCAMWTLVFLISLLLGMQDKRRMWLLGSMFIIASAAVYFLFMAAWLNIVLWLGYISWLKIIIGFVALGGGAYHLKEFFTNKTNTCKVTNTPRRTQIFEQLKAIIQRKNMWFAAIGIVLLAVAVNMVELVCSAGIPAVFTQILALNSLPTWQYYLYILLYILFFMIDDLLVFFVAMVSLQLSGLGTKYVRLSHIVGGALMLIIGLLLIFRPDLLLFG